MSKFGTFATIAGLGLIGLNSCVYTVDPGEKALIMDKLSGLKQNVYGQGYHLLIPFIQVTSLTISSIYRLPSSTTAV
jgi:regulator of protease activity HflC (stomatin/prohibitin superfamily)